MRKIAVVNFKGGTGKTTTVVNVGAGLAMRGKHVLLVDVDAQGSLAISLGLKYEVSLADALTHQAPIEKAIARARHNMDVLPGDNSLLGAQRAIARSANWQEALGALLSGIETNYDYVLLDCAASLTPLNINALTYATEIFIPTQVEYLSMMGLNQVLENLARGRFPNQPRQAIADLGISLIIPTMYDVRKKQSRRLLADLRETFGQRVSTPIRTNVRLSEAPASHKTIFEYDAGSAGAFDYNRLVDTILQETLLAGEEPIGLQRAFRPTIEEDAAEVAVPAPAAELPAGVTGVAAAVPAGPAPAAPSHLTALPNEPGAALLSMQCPYCNIPLTTIVAAGYRIYQCEHCGYQKQMLMRDMRVR